MIIHLTRHGQPARSDAPSGTDHQYPPADPILTPLGRRQAACLGQRLAELGFKGPVFSSPYRRALETAHLIAATIGVPLIPEPAMQEFVTESDPPDFDGLTAEQMRRLYPGVHPPADMPYPWFVRGPEAEAEVEARVRPLLGGLFDSDLTEVLLVGHGASVHGCLRALVPRSVPALQAEAVPYNWNCGLTTVRAEGWDRVLIERLFDVSHMPPEVITSNYSGYRDWLRPDGTSR